MKKVLVVLLFTAALFVTKQSSAQEQSSGQDYKTALGVRLSSAPAIISHSISFKHFLTGQSAVEVLFSFGEPLGIGALYEIHKPLNTPGLRWFYGGGGYLAFGKEFDATKNAEETKTLFGAQGVIGLDYKFSNLPLNLALDWKPELNLVSDINFEPAALGITARFTF